MTTSFVAAPAGPAESAGELLSLTGLRAILAWWVVSFHFVRDSLPEGLGKAIISGGYVAVDVFFVLSGYVLMRRYSRTVFTGANIGRFYVRRFARIYPLYALSLIVGVAAAWKTAKGDLATSEGQLRILAEVLLLNAWTHIAMFKYNFAAWSLSVEALFYVLCPWLLPALARLSIRRACVLLALGWLATLIWPAIYTVLDPDRLNHPLALGDEVKGAWYISFFPVQRLPEFMAGALAARLPWKPRRAAPLAALGLVALMVSPMPFVFLRTGFPLPLIVLLVMGTAGWERGPLASKVCVALGHASFATYILHWPLLFAWARFDSAIWNSLAHVFIYMGFLLVASLLAFRFVEEPIRLRITRWLTPAPVGVRPREVET
ncbi:acyltransferase [Pendulispora rubella]|uniref:Acyltransferase n=1 Tax=Pendulispora rubella TaxID=2741070 RepID=A0ABZ2KU22_9BACT